jgi:hypothetical protein
MDKWIVKNGSRGPLFEERPRSSKIIANFICSFKSVNEGSGWLLICSSPRTCRFFSYGTHDLEYPLHDEWRMVRKTPSKLNVLEPK